MGRKLLLWCVLTMVLHFICAEEKASEASHADPITGEAQANKVEANAKVVDPQAKIVHPQDKAVDLQAKEVDPKVKEEDKKAKEVDSKAKEVDKKAKRAKAKGVDSKAKKVDPKVKKVDQKAKVVDPKAKEVDQKEKVLKPKEVDPNANETEQNNFRDVDALTKEIRDAEKEYEKSFDTDKNHFEKDYEIQDEDAETNAIRKAVKEFEKSVDIVKNHFEKELLPEDMVEEFIENLSQIIANIIELLKISRDSVYKFIEMKGIERVLAPYLLLDAGSIRHNLLTLTELLFDVAPATTSAVMPITALDKLLMVFEEDDNMEVKARTMHIFYVWLPDNPKVQDRLMKIGGLEPFYEHIEKLDANVVNIQMRIVSKIIKEHIRLRTGYYKKTKADDKTVKIYKRIGMLDYLSSDILCHGLFTVFQNVWDDTDSNDNQTKYLHPVFEIISDLEPFCNEKIGGEDTIHFLRNIAQYLETLPDGTIMAYEGLGLNTTKFKNVVHWYLDKLDPLDVNVPYKIYRKGMTNYSKEEMLRNISFPRTDL